MQKAVSAAQVPEFFDRVMGDGGVPSRVGLSCRLDRPAGLRHNSWTGLPIPRSTDQCAGCVVGTATRSARIEADNDGLFALC
jgi:hypothetical protein